MGTEALVLVVGGDEDEAIDLVVARLRDLERRWSRFLPDSEVSRLNARSGRPVVLSPETFELVAAGVAAWRATDGRFDPTVLLAVCAAGYDRDFAQIDQVPARPPAGPRPAPGCGSIRMDAAVGAVWFPPGVGFDPGGIGKGLAADMVSREVLARGASGVMVNVGGDLRVRGNPAEGREWVVSVEDPRSGGQELLRIGLAEGAVATSSRLRRRWRAGGEARHHLIDPSTGAPARTSVASATVIAAEAWWAEACATAVCVSEPPPVLPARDDASVVVVGEDGSVLASPELAGMLR